MHCTGSLLVESASHQYGQTLLPRFGISSEAKQLEARTHAQLNASLDHSSALAGPGEDAQDRARKQLAPSAAEGSLRPKAEGLSGSHADM